MKRKNISILLFILVFVGVAMLGYTPARADWVRDCGGTYWDGTSIPMGSCFEVKEDGTAVYLLKAFVGCEIPATHEVVDCEADGAKEIPVHIGYGPNDNWPIRDDSHDPTRAIWRYITGRTYEVDAYSLKISAESYTLYMLAQAPSLGADPNGAQLPQDKIDASCDYGGVTPVDLGYRIAYKLNRLASRHSDGMNEFYTPWGTPIEDTCGHGWIIWSGLCGDGDVPVPAEGGDLIAAGLSFPAAGVEVTRNACTGAVTNVKIDGTTVEDNCDPVICFGVPGQEGTQCIDLRAEGKRVGPPFFGCVLDNSPTVMYGYGSQYYCAPASSP